MIGWGVVSMGTMFVTDVWSFMAARVLLGIAEAGFFPGMVLYLTYWIPAARARPHRRAVHDGGARRGDRRRAGVRSAAEARRAAAGSHGWQWLFLVEGLPAVVLGRARAARADRSARSTPSGCRRTIATGSPATMADEQARRQAVGHATIGRSFASGRVWLLSGVLFMNTLVNYGIFLWLPKMLQDVSGTRGFALSAITAIPFVAALVAMVLVGRHSDRTGERKLHVAACARRLPRSGCCWPSRRRGTVAAGAQLHALADGPAIAGRGVLGDAADAPGRHGGGGRHRADQRHRQSRRLLRPGGHGRGCATRPAAMRAACWCWPAR